jgi:hypothetical protein
MPAAALCVLLTGCAGSPRPLSGPFGLAGMVYDRSGAPVNGMTIILGGQHVALSDFSGRFSFGTIEPGQYEVEARKDGFETYRARLTLSTPGQVLYLSVLSADDLLDLCEASLREGRWAEADAYAERALALSPTDPQARYFSAIALASRLRPDRAPLKALEVLRALASEGYAEEPVLRLIADLEAEISGQ